MFKNQVDGVKSCSSQAFWGRSYRHKSSSQTEKHLTELTAEAGKNLSQNVSNKSVIPIFHSELLRTTQRLYMPSSVFVQCAKHCNRLPPFLHLWHLCMVIMVVIVVFVVFMVFMRTSFRTIAMEVLVVRSVVVMALCKEPAQSCLKSQKRRESQYFGG